MWSSFRYKNSIPIIELKQADFSYTDLAKFALAGLPFSLKLIPAIFCDSLFFSTVGRRKTWIIIGHMIIATALGLLYVNFDQWVVNKSINAIVFTMGQGFIS